MAYKKYAIFPVTVLNLHIYQTNPGLMVRYQINNHATDLSQIYLTGQFQATLKTGILSHCHTNPQQVRILRRLVRLSLMPSVTIWPHWFNLVSMVPQTQHTHQKWDTMRLRFYKRQTLYKMTLHVTEKIFQLLNQLSRHII